MPCMNNYVAICEQSWVGEHTPKNKVSRSWKFLTVGHSCYTAN